MTSKYRIYNVFFVIIGFVVTLNNYEFLIGNYHFSLERLLAIPLFLLLLWMLLSFRMPLLISKQIIILIIWLLMALCSSILSDVNEWSTKMYVSLILASSFYFMIIQLKIDMKAIFSSKTYLLLLFFMGPLLSLLYIYAIFGYYLPDFIVHWLQEGSGGTRLRATIYEANLFAVYLCFFILTLIALNYKSKLWWWALLFGLNLSMLFSFSRVPWLSYIISLVIYFILINPRKFNLKKIVYYFILFFILSVLIGAIVYVIYKNYGEYEIIGRTHSLSTRLIMWELAYKSILENPILGNGIFSFSELNAYAPSLVGSDTYRSAWISNIFLVILHDTGIVGFLLFFTFIFVVIYDGWKSVRFALINKIFEPHILRLGACFVSFSISLILSGQTIPAHSLAFFWVGFGLVSCFSLMVKRYKRNMSNYSISH